MMNNNRLTLIGQSFLYKNVKYVYFFKNEERRRSNFCFFVFLHSFTAFVSLFEVHYFNVAFVGCGCAGYLVVALAVPELV